MELVGLFFVVPLGVAGLAYAFPGRLPLIPALWVVAAGCAVVLWRDPTFERTRLWGAPRFRWRDFAVVAGRFGVLAVVILGVFWVLRGREVFWTPFGERLFAFPRRSPGFWALVMVLYPVLSVVPQGVVWRAFMRQRYRPLLGDGWLLLVVMAVAFALVHLIMRNGFAVAATLVGGLLFAHTYRRTGSLLLSNVEHALYGCWMFTCAGSALFYAGNAG